MLRTFYLFNMFMDWLSAIIFFAVGYLAYRGLKLTKAKIFLFHTSGFMLQFLGLLTHGIVMLTVFLYYPLTGTFPKLKLVFLVFSIAKMVYYILTAVGYLIIALGYALRKSEKYRILSTAPILPLILNTNFEAFNSALTLVLVLEAAAVYLENRERGSLKILIAFILMFISHALSLIAIIGTLELIFIAARISRYVGAILFLMFLRGVLRRVEG